MYHIPLSKLHYAKKKISSRNVRTTSGWVVGWACVCVGGGGGGEAGEGLKPVLLARSQGTFSKKDELVGLSMTLASLSKV